MEKDIIKSLIETHQQVVENIKTTLIDDIVKASQACEKAIKAGNKLLFCGNGGSAADCQHIAAEFVGRFQLTRKGLPAIALTTDTSALTAIANDFGYENVFSRQVEALGKKGDVIFCLSTSGNSKNVLIALRKAKELGILTIGITGRTGGDIMKETDVCINVSHDNTARIQEGHILIGHIICELLDDMKNEQ